MTSRRDKINKHGLNVSIAHGYLNRFLRETKDYTPKEFARNLVKFAARVDKDTTIITAQAFDLEK